MISVARVRLPLAVRRAIVAHAERDRPIECCGFLLGARGRVAYASPMRNMDASAVRYRIDDGAHIALRRVLRDLTPPLSILGVYHSHPNGEPEPSETDVAQAFYPEWVHVIVGLSGRRPEVRAFRIRDGRARRVSVRSA